VSFHTKVFHNLRPSSSFKTEYVILVIEILSFYPHISRIHHPSYLCFIPTTGPTKFFNPLLTSSHLPTSSPHDSSADDPSEQGRCGPSSIPLHPRFLRRRPAHLVRSAAVSPATHARRSRRGEERLRLAPSCRPRLVPDSGWQGWRGRGKARTSGRGLELDVPLSPVSSLLHAGGACAIKHDGGAEAARRLPCPLHLPDPISSSCDAPGF
jgi:hypothetical protein